MQFWWGSRTCEICQCLMVSIPPGSRLLESWLMHTWFQLRKTTEHKRIIEHYRKLTPYYLSKCSSNWDPRKESKRTKTPQKINSFFDAQGRYVFVVRDLAFIQRTIEPEALLLLSLHYLQNLPFLVIQYLFISYSFSLSQGNNISSKHQLLRKKLYQKRTETPSKNKNKNSNRDTSSTQTGHSY